MVSGFLKGVTTESTLTRSGEPVGAEFCVWRDRRDVRTVERPQRVAGGFLAARNQ